MTSSAAQASPTGTSKADAPAGSPAFRVSALDGLRGLASLVVVLHHVLMSNPHFPAARGDEDFVADKAWWMTWSPLHLVWEGTVAVMVFFVLSGYALSLADHRAKGYWRAYYPARLVRLYVPVAASLVVALALLAVFPREKVKGMSGWAKLHDVDVTWASLWGDLSLWDTGFLNSALWSLKYEVAFSLLLPVFIVVGRLIARTWLSLLAVPGLVWLSEFGVDHGSRMGQYLPVFGFGVLLAFNREPLERLARRVPEPVWWLAAVASPFVLTVRWMPYVPQLQPYAWPLMMLGSALVVLMFVHWPVARNLASWKPVLWLGTVSFSLYLVHEPLLISVVFLNPQWTVYLTLAVCVPLALLGAWAFHHAAEKPAHRLARAMRARSAARLAARTEAKRSGTPADERTPVTDGV